jgi:hypothetical protein
VDTVVGWIGLFCSTCWGAMGREGNQMSGGND